MINNVIVQLSKHKVFLILIALGLALRIYFIHWGLPEIYEEATPMMVALNFWNTGGNGIDLNPHFFNYPALTFYLQFAIQAICYFIGHLLNIYKDFPSFISDQTLLVIIARATSVLFDLGTAVVLYFLARRLLDNRLALLSALILIFNPLHIMEAHLIQVDTVLTFFSILALLFIVKAFETPRKQLFIYAGIAIGAAAASKYTGAMLLLVYIIAFALRFDTFQKALARWNDKSMLWGIIVAIATFFVFNPYILLDFSQFQADFSFEQYHVSYGHLGVISSQTTLGYYLIDILGNYFGWGLYAFMLLALFLIWKKRDKKYYIFVAYPLIYLLVLSNWQMRAERYILPIFPILILLGSIGIVLGWDWLASRLTKRTPAQYALIIIGLLVVLQPSVASYTYLHSLSLKDTRTLTKDWIKNHIPKGASVASGPYGVDFEPNKYEMLEIPFLAFESQRVAAFYNTRWYEDLDLLITSDYDYGRYLKEPERYKDFLPFYDTLQAYWKLEFQVLPGEDKTGPAFWLYSCPESLRHETFPPSLFERFATNPESARISNFLKGLNTILEKQGKVEKNIQLLQEILTVETGNLTLHNKLASLLINQERYNEALTQLQLSLQSNMAQPLVFAQAGKCLLKLNHPREAEATLIKAINMDKTILPAYEDLLELYKATNDTKNIQLVLEHYAAVLPPSSEKGKEVRERLNSMIRAK